MSANRRRKTKNRRILSQPVPVQRSMFKPWIKRVLAFVLGVAILSLAIYMLYEPVVHSQSFAIEEIQLSGNHRVKVPDLWNILKDASKERSVTTLSVRHEVLEAWFESHPWIRKAEVEIEMPHLIRVEIEEQVPLGLVWEDKLYLVNVQGEIFKEVDRSNLIEGPIVTGFDGKLLKGDPEAQREVRSIFKWIEAYRKAGLNQWASLSEIRCDGAVGFSIFTQKPRVMEIRWAWDRWAQRFERLKQIYAWLEAHDVEVEYILLDQDDALKRIAVKPIPKEVLPKPEENRDQGLPPTQL